MKIQVAYLLTWQLHRTLFGIDIQWIDEWIDKVDFRSLSGFSRLHQFFVIRFGWTGDIFVVVFFSAWQWKQQWKQWWFPWRRYAKFFLIKVRFIKSFLLAYASPDGPSYNFNIPETNYGSYDAKPAVHLDSYGPPKVHHQESYGPPKQSYSYSAEPHQAYGAPEYGKTKARKKLVKRIQISWKTNWRFNGKAIRDPWTWQMTSNPNNNVSREKIFIALFFFELMNWTSIFKPLS